MNPLRLRPLATLLALTAACAFAPRATAQQNAAGDTAAVLSQVARDVEASGDADFAEALLRHIVARYPGTQAAAEARSRLESRFADRATDRSGALELHVWSTLYGLWLGAAIPGALGADDSAPYGIGLLLGGPTGYLAARSFLGDRRISVGQARAISWGGTWGTWQGYGWGDVLGLTTETREHTFQTCADVNQLTGQCARFETVTYRSQDQDAQKVFASLIAGGLLGVAAGSFIAGRGEISPGTATLVNFGSLWGSWYAVALGVIANQDQHEDRLLLWTLLGGNVGLVTTAMIAPKYNISRPRARIINLAGVVGLLGGFGVNLLLQPDDEAVLFGIPLATSAAGLALGASMTRDYDRMAVRKGEAGGWGTALLQLRAGQLELGVPMPAPTRVRGDGGVGLRVELLEGRF